VSALLLLVPFIAWDMVIYLLRLRGDRSLRRRAAVLRHFSWEDVLIGREQTRRRMRLFPWSRLVFYVLFALVVGLGARAEAWLLALTGHWAAALPLFVLLLLLAWALLTLPVAAYSELVIERRAGLSTTTRRTFVVDQLKGLGVGWALATLLAYPVIGLVRGLPVWWPVPAAATVLAISAVVIWISPWVIAPLFNRFQPLSDEALARRVQQLTLKAGMRVATVLVADASRRSTTLNAYFTGLGNSRRVVLFDTLVQDCDAEEVLGTVAHELGHWKHHHIASLFALQAVGTVLGLALLKLVLDSVWWRDLLGLPHPSSLVLLGLLPLLGALTGRVVGPFMAAVSRRFERQADRYAIRITTDPAAFIRLEMRLVRRARGDLLVPRLLHRLYGSHPLPEERICAAEAFGSGPGPGGNCKSANGIEGEFSSC